MRNVTAPARDDMVDYRSAIARRPAPTRTVLSNLENAIQAAYTSYSGEVAAILALEPLAFEDPDPSDLLRGNYSSLANGRALEDLAAAIYEAANFRCPMCNFEQASTLDHFLAKSNFPEFCVLARNLVASCFTCNHRKGAQAANGFVHPYFDRIPEEQILLAGVSWAPEFHVAYSLQRPNGMDDNLFARLDNQFQGLGISDRLAREAGYVLTEIRQNCGAPYAQGGAGLVRSELLRQAHNAGSSYGLNH